MKTTFLFMLVAGILLSNNGFSLLSPGEEVSTSEESFLEEESEAKKKEADTETENEGDKEKDKEESNSETEEDKTKYKEETKTEKENEEDKANKKKNINPSKPLDGPISLVPSGEIEYGVLPETSFENFVKVDSKETDIITKGKIGEDHPTEMGEIMVFKEAQPVKGKVNTWEVTLRVEAMNKPKTSDVVLVIDRSGSMGGDNIIRMENAKKAAKKFAETLLSDGYIRLGIISYSDKVSIDQGLTCSYDDIMVAIEALKAGGGTFTQAALRQAREVLDNSDATNKYIVLVSDGEPTYSYALKNPRAYLSTSISVRNITVTYYKSDNDTTNILVKDKTYGYDTISDIPKGQFIYSKVVGAGMYMWHAFYTTGAIDRMYNHGHSTMAEASYLGDEGYNIFAIGLQAGRRGKEILGGINQGIGTFTEVDKAEDLTPILEKIASEIEAAVRNGVVTDTMGEGFEISEENIGKIWTSQGEAAYEDNTITWTLDSLIDPIYEGSDVHYAELKYIVEINDDILGVNSEDGLYPANEIAYFRCLGIDDCEKYKEFPIPMVKPLIGKITKEVQNKDGKVIQKDEDFGINISGPDNFEKSYFINTSDGNKSLNFTDLRTPGEYTLEEVGDLSGYNITYLVNGKEGNKFLVREDNGEDIDLKIINKEKCGKIVINKELEENNLQEIPSFEFKVTGPNGFEEVFTLPENDKWVKEIYDIELGKYTVTELTDSYKTSVKVEDGEFENKKSVEVNINNTCLEKNIHFKNEFEKFDFQIQKRSSKYDVNLENAGFTLYSTNGSWEQGKELDVKMTGSNGLAKFEKLIPGSYILKETTVPEGHTIEADFWKVEVDTSGNVNLSTNKDKEVKTEIIDGIPTYIIYNLTGVYLPITGNIGKGPYFIIGSSLAAITLLVLYKKGKSHGKSK